MTTVELSSGFSPTFHPRSLPPFSGDHEDSGPRAEAASAPSHAHQGRATRAEMIRRDASSSTSVEDDARVDTAALASRVSSGAEGASNRRGSSPLGKTARGSLHRQGIQRVKSTPELGVHATGPAPGSKEMRDMFFVRQDAVNFNASYGTPVREVRGGIVGNLLRRTWMRLFFGAEGPGSSFRGASAESFFSRSASSEMSARPSSGETAGAPLPRPRALRGSACCATIRLAASASPAAARPPPCLFRRVVSSRISTPPQRASRK